MKNKLKYLPSLTLTLITIFAGTVLAGSYADAATEGSKTASVTVIPACYFTNTGTSFSTSVTVPAGSEQTTEGLAKTTFQFTCGSSNGFSIQAVGFSPNTSGGDGVLGNTNLYSTLGTIATGTSGSTSYWAFKVSSATSSTSYTITDTYDDYHAVPGTATDIVSYQAPASTGTAVTGTLRTDYKISAAISQPVGTYVGAVKYILAID